MGDLSDFINALEIKKDSILPFVYDYDELILSLRELNSVTGMDSLKKDIVSKGKWWLSSQFSGLEETDEVMHHFILSGPPGCGKTSICKILAKVYISFGFIRRPTKEQLQDIEKKREEKSDEKKSFLDSIFSSIQTEFEEGQKAKRILEGCLLDISDMLLSEKNSTKRIRELNQIRDGIVDSIKILSPTENEEEEKIEVQSLLKIYKRDNLISGYLGQTAGKTMKALEAGLGGLILIDEAYSLVTSNDDDPYGLECLTMINQFMSEYGKWCCIVFAGYEDKINSTVFEVQPGLKRRFSKSFKIEGYTPKELAHIFLDQLSREGWRHPLSKVVVEESPPVEEVKKVDSPVTQINCDGRWRKRVLRAPGDSDSSDSYSPPKRKSEEQKRKKRLHSDSDSSDSYSPSKKRLHSDSDSSDSYSPPKRRVHYDSDSEEFKPRRKKRFHSDTDSSDSSSPKRRREEPKRKRRILRERKDSDSEESENERNLFSEEDSNNSHPPPLKKRKIEKIEISEESVESISPIFIKNKDYFPNFGGDTLRLFQYCKEEAFSKNFDLLSPNLITFERVISNQIIELGIDKLKLHLNQKKKDNPPDMMYI